MCDICIICFSTNNEQKIHKKTHLINHNFFFKKEKCKYMTCEKCFENCIKNYGKDYCPFCRNVKRKTQIENENIHVDEEESFYETHLFDNVMNEHVIINKFHKTVNYNQMSTFEFYKYIILTMLFSYFIVLPAFGVLYICNIFDLKNKNVILFSSYSLSLFMTCFLIKGIKFCFFG